MHVCTHMCVFAHVCVYISVETFRVLLTVSIRKQLWTYFNYKKKFLGYFTESGNSLTSFSLDFKNPREGMKTSKLHGVSGSSGQWAGSLGW